MQNHKFSRHLLKSLYLSCCYEEIKVNKPGNVSVKSPKYGMNFMKFYRAAEISSKYIINKNYNVCESIYFACKNCLKELGSNYNLGIILMITPIIKTVSEDFNSILDLRVKLKKKLNSINSQNTNLIKEAIKISNPGGINNYSGTGNIMESTEKQLNFREMIKISSCWDRISKSYMNSYREIFECGLPFFFNSKKQFSRKFSIERLFIYYMSIEQDSHILRKYNKERAISVSYKAKKILNHLKKENKYAEEKLINFDKYLKFKNLNPGTCADLTVTTLLIDKITDIVSISNLKKN